MMIVGSLSSVSFADDGVVYPDSADVSFTRTLSFDTVLVTVQNSSADSVHYFFLSDFTDSQTVLIECAVDGATRDSVLTDLDFGGVYPEKYTTRWVIGDFSQSVFLKYYSPLYSGNDVSFSAGHPYAIFGIFGPPHGIGPPRFIEWIQGN